MVKICTKQYLNEFYNNYFEKYPFILSDFQKYAIESIVSGNHILITAHTGSGKTLPAEFAIEHFVSCGKKVIYTSPIKALSNQKYYDFTNKFPNISFGILTGDIKFNPEADVLIMTTEILRNTLLSKQNQNDSIPLQFEMDFKNELACVVFDEIHYINDQDRGKIWEETIMLLPEHIQMVMLSATIDKPEMFAKWIEETKNSQGGSKEVYLAPTNHRVVPLKHYLYCTVPQGTIKLIKDKEYRDELKQFLQKPFLLKDNSNKFNEIKYFKDKKLETYLRNNNSFIKSSFVLNDLIKYLNSNNMLPAICFVFSRKQVEKLADQINQTLFEPDSVLPGSIRHECEHILKKLPNYKEYINIPEYEIIMRLLEKGIAIHHSGIMPVFREMIELMFSKGYIKLLFATETFAVGINMPTKTVVFTSFEKFNGSNMRYLLPHEYTQMAGRAGRRGLDTIGHVIHCNNLFKIPDKITYFNMLNGSPQSLKSKFKVTFNLVLNLQSANNLENKSDFTSKSMIKKDIESEINNVVEYLKECNESLRQKKENVFYSTIEKNIEEFKKYIKLQEDLTYANNKKRKNLTREIDSIKQQDRQFDKKLEYYRSILHLEQEISKNNDYHTYMLDYFNYQIENVIEFLTKHNFINDNLLSLKGKYACSLQEAHCLVLSELLEETNCLKDFNSNDIICLFSCFTNIKVNDDFKTFSTTDLTEKKELNNLIYKTQQKLDKFNNSEVENNIDSGEQYEFHFDIVKYVLEWCECDNESMCKQIIHKLSEEKDIFLGEFVKAILKINNLANEFTTICEQFGYVELQHKLSEIPNKTLKFVATNQSLYV